MAVVKLSILLNQSTANACVEEKSVLTGSHGIHGTNQRVSTVHQSDQKINLLPSAESLQLYPHIRLLQELGDFGVISGLRNRAHAIS